MKKLKVVTLLVLISAVLLGSIPLTMSSTNTDVITGGNADFDYVYVAGENVEEEVTSEADKDDGDTFMAFNGPRHSETEYLYLGMDSEFDKVFVDIENAINLEDEEDNNNDHNRCIRNHRNHCRDNDDNDDEDEDDEDDEDNEDNEDCEITWEYSDAGTWTELDVNSDDIDCFDSVGVSDISFDIPSDWDKETVFGDTAYFIRAKVEGDIEEGAEIEQASARVYNLTVNVETEGGQSFTNLSSSNFSLENATDTKIYGFEKEDSNTYVLAVQSEAVDTTYTVVITVDGYTQVAMQTEEVDSDMQTIGTSTIETTVGCTDPFYDTDYHWAQTAITDLYCRGIVEGEDNNMFMVNHTVTRAEFLKMALLNADAPVSKYKTYNVPFRDVSEDDWYYEYVATAYELDVIDGDDVYYPDAEISRVEALTILVRLSGLETDATATRFTDVYSSDWFAATVRLGTDYDVVEGYPDGTFQPERNLTRAEAAVMVNNAYNAWYQE